MSLLGQIREPVTGQLALYEEYVRRMLESASPQLGPLTGHVLKSRGKSIRPLVVMLTAGLYPDTEQKSGRALVGATLIEMVHTASLVHDDIVDEAYIRRSKPSVNALWGNHLAVLVGDYIISRAFDEGLASGHYDIISAINRSLTQICEGEILQSYQSDHLTMTREIYLDIIRKKTALLLGTAASLGAMAAHAPQSDADNLFEYGVNVGIAFQMRDDVLDYAPQSQTGKPASGDLRERKINMPLLCLLEKSSSGVRRELLRKLSAVRRSPANVDFLRNAVVESGALDATSAQMQNYLDRAMASLEAYPASPCKESLALLCNYVASRSK